MNKFKKITILAGSLTLAATVPVTTIALVNKNKKPTLPNNNAQVEKIQAQYNDLLQQKTKLQDQIGLITHQQGEISKLVEQVAKSTASKIKQLIDVFNNKVIGQHTKLMIDKVNFYIVQYNHYAEGTDKNPIFSSVDKAIALNQQTIPNVEEMLEFLKINKDTEKQTFILNRIKEIEKAVSDFLARKHEEKETKEKQLKNISSQLNALKENLDKAKQDLSDKARENLNLKNELDQIKKAKSELEQKLGQANADKETLEKEKEKLEKRLKTLEEEKIILLQEEVRKLQEELKDDDFSSRVLKVAKTIPINYTIYLAKDGTVQSTNEQDLSNMDITRIFRIGFYQGIGNAFRIIQMPKTIQRVPIYLPKKITSTWDAFKGTTSFNQDISMWDVSNVNDMYAMFFGCKVFNNGGKALNWNSKVKNVWRFQQMFEGATSFNQSLDWDTSLATNMHNMFNGASEFNQPLNWNTSKVADMSGMFSEASKFNQNLSEWNTKSVTKRDNFSNNQNWKEEHKPKFN